MHIVFLIFLISAFFSAICSSLYSRICITYVCSYCIIAQMRTVASRAHHAAGSRLFDKETLHCQKWIKKKREGYVTQDVSRGGLLPWRRACLSEAAGRLFCGAPLYHFNSPIGYDSDNCSIVYALDTHENSVDGRVRVAHAKQWTAMTGEHFWRERMYV